MGKLDVKEPQQKSTDNKNKFQLSAFFTLLIILILFLFIYSFFNVDNCRKNTVYNKNSSKMLIDVNTLVKKRKQNYWT